MLKSRTLSLLKFKVPIGLWINLWIGIFTFVVFFGGLVFFRSEIRTDSGSTGIGGYVYIGWLVFTVGCLGYLLLSRLIFRKNPRWIRSIIENFRD